MTSTNAHLVAIIFFLSMLLAGAKAQSNCSNVLLTLAPCLSFVTGSSTNPSSSCCTQLTNVVQSQPSCLCTVLNGGSGNGGVGPLGSAINQTQALALPGACRVKTPPVSQCNVANGPAMSPIASPLGSPEAMPGNESNGNLNGSSLTGPGSRAIPPTPGKSSHGSVIKPIQPVLFMFLASYATFSVL